MTYLGEINTIVALLFCIVIIAPRFIRTEKSLSSTTTDKRDRTIFKIVRILLQLVPVVLIALIALGYYYTALNFNYTLLLILILHGLCGRWCVIQFIVVSQ